MSEKVKKIVYNVNQVLVFLAWVLAGIVMCSSIIYHAFGIYPDALSMIVKMSGFLCLGATGSWMIMDGISEFIWHHDWYIPPYITGLLLILISIFGILMFGFGVGLPFGILIFLGHALMLSWVFQFIWLVRECRGHF